MATSKTGGAFGFLRKSVGSITYATQKDRNGKRVQIARQKITEMENPQTYGQCLQRMKLKPAQRFYAAINGADGSRLLEHSWEGIKYGADGLREFMSRAMKANGPFIPKEATRFIPAKYEISAGSIPAVLISVNQSGFLFGAGSVDSSLSGLAQMVDALTKVAGTADSQITFVMVKQENDGTFTPELLRVIPSQLETLTDFPVSVSSSSLLIAGKVALGIIISRKDATGSWLRSGATMVLTSTLEANLYGDAARETAVQSYMTSESVNNINSAWYLNLANGQPFSGQLSVYNNPDGADTNGAVVGTILDQYGDIIKYAFTDTGLATGKLAMVVDGAVVYSNTLTGADAQNDFANEIAQWKPNYANQLGF